MLAHARRQFRSESRINVYVTPSWTLRLSTSCTSLELHFVAFDTRLLKMATPCEIISNFSLLFFGGFHAHIICCCSQTIFPVCVLEKNHRLSAPLRTTYLLMGGSQDTSGYNWDAYVVIQTKPSNLTCLPSLNYFVNT